MKKLMTMLSAASAAFVCGATPLDTSGFAKKMPITMAGYSGSSTLTNFPVLVKLAEADNNGFHYSDFKGTAGSDLRFADADDNELPFEIDTWNPSGTSLVWVAVSGLKTNTVINAYYGNSSPAAAPAATNVWGGYVGVWHLSELGGGGTSADSTMNTINGTNADCTTGMVGGVIGNCRRISDAAKSTKGGGILVPGFTSLGITQPLAISTWLRHKAQQPNYDHLFYKRNTSQNDNPITGFAVEFDNGNWGLAMRGASSTAGTYNSLPGGSTGYMSNEWVHVELVFINTTCYIYANGVNQAHYTVTAVNASTYDLAFGTDSDQNDINFKGEFDEMRVSSVVPSDDWVKAEYETVKSSAFAVVGTVETIDPTRPTLKGVTIADVSGVLSVTGIVVCSVGGTFAAVFDDGTAITTNAPAGTFVAGTNAFSFGLASLAAADKTFSVSVFGVSSASTTSKVASAGTFYNGTLTLAKVSDAAEQGLVPGTVTVSRASADNVALTVNYTFAGTGTSPAVAGTDYVAPVGSVTIPAGVSSAVIEVVPILDVAKTVDTALSVAFAAGSYLPGNAVTVSIANYVVSPVQYVATTGNDANDGFTEATAKLTISNAVALLDQVGYGSIHVASGFYPIKKPIIVTNAIAILADSADPSQTVVSNSVGTSWGAQDQRVFRLGNAGAFLSGLTIANGSTTDALGNSYLGGAGVYIDVAGGTVSNCVITGCATTGWGADAAGVCIASAAGLVTHCVISDGRVNYSVGGTGALGVHVANGGRLDNCLVYRNTGNWGTKGAAVLVDNGAVVNCTIVTNGLPVADLDSGCVGLRLSSVNAFATNCVMAGNYGLLTTITTNAETSVVSTNVTTRLAPFYCGAKTTNAVNCATDGDAAITPSSIIGTAATFFVDAANGDYTASKDGGLYNAGADVGWTENDLDLAGKPRVAHGRIDIGCYECQRSREGGFVIRIQ